MTVEQVRENLSELLFHDPNADLLIDQLCQLWSVWKKNENETQPQKYYQGLTSLKQFNSILFRVRPRVPRGKEPIGADTPMAKLLAKHLNRSEANAVDD